ncbi:unnamed protein product [Rhodiola kirilowii]
MSFSQLSFALNLPDYVSKKMDIVKLKQAAMQFKYQVSLKRGMSSSLSLPSTRSLAKQKVTSTAAGASCFVNENSNKRHTLIDQAFLYGEVEVDDDDPDQLSGADNQTEMLRRKRIGLANKGKIPWNKGVTHNEETRQKIKQRTIEALKNPEVRKKMSECYRDRSDQCKEKISVSLRHVWAKRLNYPRQREEFYISWYESIAIAAKKGGKDQKELGWDSFVEMTEELARQKEQQALNEVKSKVKAMVSAKRITNSKTDMFSALGGSEHVTVDQPKKRITRKKCSKRDNDEKIVVPGDLNLQTRLSKLQIKRPAAVTIKADTQSSLAWEKIDLEYVKMENRQRVSLADQIQAAKNRRQTFKSSENKLSTL